MRLLIIAITRPQSAALRAPSIDFLAITLASIGDAVIATNTTEHVTFLNEIAEQLMGWTRAEAIG